MLKNLIEGKNSDKFVDQNYVKKYLENALRLFKETGYDVLTMKNVGDEPVAHIEKHHRIWAEKASLIASAIALKEGFVGNELITRATSIFEDATRYEPQTSEGIKARDGLKN